mmetsp:Transcript_4347/g.9658  ORF Transcript_4347/g.9658 Transcript_4347/m.9658 type:complete len:409 (+) Transcript_4347:44-1270(+)
MIVQAAWTDSKRKRDTHKFLFRKQRKRSSTSKDILSIAYQLDEENDALLILRASPSVLCAPGALPRRRSGRQPLPPGQRREVGPANGGSVPPAVRRPRRRRRGVERRRNARRALPHIGQSHPGGAGSRRVHSGRGDRPAGRALRLGGGGRPRRGPRRPVRRRPLRRPGRGGGPARRVGRPAPPVRVDERGGREVLHHPRLPPAQGGAGRVARGARPAVDDRGGVGAGGPRAAPRRPGRAQRRARSLAGPRRARRARAPPAGIGMGQVRQAEQQRRRRRRGPDPGVAGRGRSVAVPAAEVFQARGVRPPGRPLFEWLPASHRRERPLGCQGLPPWIAGLPRAVPRRLHATPRPQKPGLRNEPLSRGISLLQSRKPRCVVAQLFGGEQHRVRIVQFGYERRTIVADLRRW